MERPGYLSEHWFRTRVGLAIRGPIPPHVQADSALQSSNPWERIVHVFWRAQAGDFQRAETLLDVIDGAADWHLQDCAIRVFALTAPWSVLLKLAAIFDHPNSNARFEGYSVAVLTGDPRLATALAGRRGRVESWQERESVEGAISNMLEPWIDDLELFESKLDGESYQRRVQRIVASFEERYGKGTFIHRSEPLDARKLVSTITSLASEEDEEELFLNHAPIAELLDMLEGMTGIPCAGCLDHPIRIELAKVSRALDTVKASGILDKLEPGHRYFFGHRIP